MIVAHATCHCGAALQWEVDSEVNGDGLARHFRLLHPERMGPLMESALRELTKQAEDQARKRQPL